MNVCRRQLNNFAFQNIAQAAAALTYFVRASSRGATDVEFLPLRKLNLRSTSIDQLYSRQGERDAAEHCMYLEVADRSGQRVVTQGSLLLQKLARFAVGGRVVQAVVDAVTQILSQTKQNKMR